MDNTTRALLHLVHLHRIPVTLTSLKNELENHPDYPSLLSISEVLSEWGIENSGYQIQNDSSDLINVPSPFIAHLRGGKFITVKKVANDHVLVINKKSKEQRFDIKAFQDAFTGNLLVVNSSGQGGEDNYSINKFKEILNSIRVPFLVTGTLIVLFILTLFYSSYLIEFNWQRGLLTLFLAAGLAASVFLLIETIDSNNPFVRKFCRGKNVSCQAILSSKGAKIFWGELSWSEVGFFYFAGSLLLVLFHSTSTVLMQLLAIINIFSLPYTFYSIYYQKFIATKWCLLCCTVQLLLWGEFLLLLPNLYKPFSVPSIIEWMNLFVCFFSPLLFWFFVKPYLLKSQQSKASLSDLKRFRNNFNLFRKVLTEQVQYNLLEEKYTILLGNVESSNTVTIITNPFCAICDQINETLEKWVLKNDNFKLQIVFAIDDQQGDVAKVARRLMNLHAIGDKQLVARAFAAWHQQEKKDYTSWAALYPSQESEEVNAILVKQQEWCSIVDLRYTPTIFINGYKLPELYRIEDIKYFLFNNHLN